MADDVTFQSATLATPAAGETIAADDVGGVKYQVVKLNLGGNGASDPVITTLPVSDAGGSLTVDGPITDAQLRATVVPVGDGGGSLTVDGPLTDAQLRAAAVPVSGTFWQATQPVSTAALPLPTGAATEATLAAQTGSLTETAPATDTASSGLNGRLQRIAQRLTSLIALLPTSLGQKAMAASLAVTVASDQSAIPASGDVANDAADSGNPVKMGAKASDTPPAAVTANDRVNLWAKLNGSLATYMAYGLNETDDRVRAITEGYKTTYSAGFVALAPAVAATDILEIIGSATKTVRILRIQISGVATAAGAYNVQLIKRSAAATGGTSSSATIVPHDSANAAGTAVANGYTANPTPGAIVGIVRSQRITVSTGAGAIPIVPVVFDFTTRNGQGIVLRGVAQTLCLNLAGATMTGGLLDIDIEFSEE